MWGGRFSEPPDAILWNYKVDPADRRLLVDDLHGSLAHVTMLASVGLITAEESHELHNGLRRLLADAADGTFEFVDTDEDVHTAVERRLHEVIGPAAGKLHTGRSRNDQIVLDLRLYLRRAGAERVAQLEGFVRLLADLAERHADTVIPSYTHLQQAQPVPLGHHLLAYAFMAFRDRDRFLDALDRINVSPLGAGAGGGSSLPLDPARSAAELDLAAVFENSLDAVASRDFVAEYAFCCAQAMVHLSRLAEEIILWSTIEFDWVTFADRYTTGSSALPHKKNPDLAEHARGRTAAVIGDLTTLMALQKGLPLAYNSDLQDDKPPLFRADDTLAGTLTALAGMLAGADFHPPPPSSWTTSLDLAESLVRRGVPFRQAHEAVGKLVVRLLGAGRTLAEATDADLAGTHPLLEPADLMGPAESIRRRSTWGGGSPSSVHRQVAEIRRRLG
jgi:argininosuccinate lyase